jgi:hypothetical protein
MGRGGHLGAGSYAKVCALAHTRILMRGKPSRKGDMNVVRSCNEL